MTDDPAQAIWMSDRERVTLDELSALSGLPEPALRELVDYGVLQPANPGEAQWVFGAHWVVAVRTACRLRNDFELDLNALALTLSFLDRIRALEAQLGAVHALLPQRRRWP